MARPKKSTTTVVDEMKTSEVITKVEKFTPETVLNSLNALQTNTQKLLGTISASFVQSLGELKDVQSTIDFKKSELERLHQIEVNLETLGKLEEEIEQKRSEFASEEDQKLQDREREEEEFSYTLAKKRKEELDAYNEKNTVKTKAWTERENALSLRENELKELQAKVAGFDTVLASEVTKARDTLKGILDTHYKTEARIKAAEVDSQVKLLESEKKALLERNQQLSNDIQVLKDDLNKARDSVVQVSTKALESASGRDTVNALQNVVNQNNNQGKKG